MNESDKITNPRLAEAEDEIDLIALAKTLWDGRKTVIKTIVICTILGLLIAIVSPKQYTVNTIMVPQVGGEKSSMGGLSSLAAMAGINLDMSTGSELSPMIYPQIVQSIPFQMELMQTKLNFEGYNEKISFYDFYTDPQYSKFNLLSAVKKYTIGLPGIIITAIRGKKELPLYTDEADKILQPSEDEMELIELLSSVVYLDVNEKEGYITLTAIMPEARAAAQLGQKAQSLLQEKIIEFKIEKARDQLDFVQERYNEKEKEFNNIQEKLARFRDKNKNIITEIGKTELERYQSEYLIVSSVFTELSKQLESSKIQVKKETPVFSIIEPISIPNERSKPDRKMILVIWIFLGGVIGVGWIFGKQFLGTIKSKWKEEDNA
jgi:LPS O-antigen subunit length determinant protein (WzzB/FepE family)